MQYMAQTEGVVACYAFLFWRVVVLRSLPHIPLKYVN
jgi:hypothetical protein